MAVQITRLSLSAADLRRAASRTSDSKQTRRILAIAMVLDGRSRLESARACGMDRQTLRDWVHRYNADGIAGLSDAHRPGRRPTLDAQAMEELRDLVLAGPDPALDGVVRWRCVDLRSAIQRRYSVTLDRRTVGRLLGRLGMTRLQPRPYHPKKDVEAQEAFKKNFATHVAEALPPRAAGKAIEVWFQDEARVGQQGTLAYVWAPIGSRPPMVRDNRHESAYLFGAICPDRAVGAAIVMPWVGSEAMSIHLAEISRCVSNDAHAVLVCDGAGWHQPGQRLSVPDNITLLRLPPYAPELNPIENVWQYLRANKLSAIVWDSYDAVVHACCDAWNWLMHDTPRIASVTHRDWAQVRI